ncbi:MAG: hypothetical protein F4X82_02905 [Candidatus Spechtbacteria bacterium SB0662_bin_43]|uniref:Nuclease-associated modular DNA-binding 1 domain-containing protein n=1 Tax=Candidatus Spechtbacteria bacterium SB0662_bin_43 TaxID=2604897 RepID=A0A845D9Q8_9BACT|nr:hypothetical protein [Candidatus Spechtbacteria bacterium SB0662_bin_43]
MSAWFCVVAYDHNGAYVRTYANQIEAAREIGATYSTIVTVLDSPHKTVRGLRLRKYKKGTEILGRINPAERAVIAYKPDGTFYRKYRNRDVAAKEMGVSPQAISNAINGRQKTASGMQWRKYEGDEQMPRKINPVPPPQPSTYDKVEGFQ